MHLFAKLIERARKTPNGPFCWFDHVPTTPVFTLGMLASEAGAYAAALTAADVRAGQIVPIVLDHGPALFSSFVGCTLAGAVPAFLPPLTRKQDPNVFRASMCALLKRIKPGCVIGSAATRPSLDLQDRIFIDSASVIPSGLPAVPKAASSDLAFLQHSSGTTGLKKGVCLTHGTVLRQVEAYARAIAARPGDVVASWLPLYHDMGLITSFLMPAVLGLPISFLDPLVWVVRPTLLLEAIERRRATLCWQPNFAFHHTVRLAGADERWDLSSLRLMVNCSEPCRASAFAAFAERFAASRLNPHALATSYAMAENVFAVTQTLPGADVRAGSGAASGFLSSGSLIEGVDLRITNEAGEDEPDGTLGEIRVAGQCLFGGYYRQPELTAARLRDGWYRTGDVGLRDGGELYVIGRLDDVLNINGRKLVAHEIEDALNTAAGIAPGRVLAYASHDPDSGNTELALAAERLPGHPAPDAEVASELRRIVFGICGLRPHHVYFAPRGFLLKSTSGKIAREASIAKLKAYASNPEGL